MPNIKHIVHVMLENRSFDNLLGWLYEEEEKKNIITVIDPDHPSTFHGLRPDLYNLDVNGTPQPVIKGTDGDLKIPAWDPHEVFEHVHKQCYTSLTPGVENPTDSPEMGGFYQDYYGWFENPEDIMKTYTPADLPVINGLAKNFAVCDQWFASIPSQTNCNRAFAATGNSIGTDHHTGQQGAWVDNHFDTFDPAKLKVNFSEPTHWNILSNQGYHSTEDWMIYYNKLWYLSDYCYTRDLFSQIQDSSFNDHFDHITTFYERASAGTLPSYSYIEPSWGNMLGPIGIQGNDYHPPTNVGPGEEFLHDLYQAISKSPCWNETLFIITFDEHGGTYDHFPIAKNAAPPWQDGHPAKPNQLECNFAFDTFGVRVPAIFVSPQIQANTVFREAPGNTPFDHTSLIATILKWKNIDPATCGLGARVANAPTFEAVLNAEKLRKDVPMISPNFYEAITEDEPANDLQKSVVARAVLHAIKKNQVDEQEAIHHYQQHVHSADTLATLRFGFDLVMKKIHGLEA
jgi:phospholipase C